MKRFSLVFISLLLVVCMAGTVSAEAYSDTIYTTNFERNYGEYHDNKAIYVKYTMGGLFTDVSGYTAVSVPNDAYGNAYVQVWGLNGQVDYSIGYTVSNNWINSGVAGPGGTDFAKRMIHTGERTISGYTDTWTITYQ